MILTDQDLWRRYEQLVFTDEGYREAAIRETAQLALEHETIYAKVLIPFKRRGFGGYVNVELHLLEGMRRDHNARLLLEQWIREQLDADEARCAA